MIRKLFHFEAKTKEERHRYQKRKKLLKKAKGNEAQTARIKEKYPSSSESEKKDE
jgi:hypothetical protein